MIKNKPDFLNCSSRNDFISSLTHKNPYFYLKVYFLSNLRNSSLYMLKENYLVLNRLMDSFYENTSSSVI